MKIVIATPIYPPEIGGPATYVKELCERLKNEHQITVVAYTDVREAFLGTTLIPVSKLRPLPIRLMKFFFAVYKASKDADLIYVQNAMAAGLPVALVSIIRHKPFALKFVGDEAWERATQLNLTKKLWEEWLKNPDGGLRVKVMMKIQGFVLRKANVVTTPSAYLLEELVRSYGIDKKCGVVNYNAAEEREILPFDIKKVQHQIVTTARLISLKNIDGIIRALSIIKKKYPDSKLIIGGEGPEMERLKSLSNELHLQNDVIFLGKISRAETWKIRKESEIYVINSSHEGLPITVLTSLAAGIPNVATNIPGINEVIYQEKTGLLIEPNNIQALAEAIMRLFEDKELYKKIVENGFALLKSKFSWETHLEILSNIFQSILSKPRNIV